MYFSEREMLCRYDKKKIPKSAYDHLMMLRERLNNLGSGFLPPRILTCAYRDAAHNARVGGAKKSCHLIGAACDIADSDGKLKDFLRNNPQELVRADLYAEDYDHTPTWVHLQTMAPKSGKRVFIP